ncbi:MAG TPA: glutamine amidotransferase [Myxococcales bacterium]|nr:glutamine amidotransferase [Deltaproteobacteria bacterium]MBU50193.1 glutamine amidotransferase [Deltaproteobacteria bacterium]HAA56086.1 glutamine amidotransferase [Myxococcales bacterium]|tara:strand:+ start:3607 stop:4311 length:705 start_codon:yes stop_codon:yes gene_type:complete
MLVGIIGDYKENSLTHETTEEALFHAAHHLNTEIDLVWIDTSDAGGLSQEQLEVFSGFLMAPGTYKDPAGALHVIKWARTQQIPLLGTCQGFQHVALEYARHVLDITDAQHAEYTPNAEQLVISPLGCSLVGESGEILLEPTSNAVKWYETTRITEEYRCAFGLHPSFEARFEEHGFSISGRDQDGQARLLELQRHPFFLATLFVPQLSSLFELPHPLFIRFVQAVSASYESFQ